VNPAPIELRPPVNGLGPWSAPEWLDAATRWLDDRLGDEGLERIGAVEQPHLRPWATVLRAPTSGGPVWLKATSTGTAFELAVYEVLGEVAPDRILTPIAADRERGWLLLPDGGRPLGEGVPREELAAVMERVLPQYGRLQLDLSGMIEPLLAGGTPDMRPAAMPARFEEALRVAERFAAEDGSQAAALAELQGGREEVARWCERLAASPVPASLDHNDLHAWNVLTDGGGGFRFYDWGDGVVSHPFASMLVGLGFVQEHILGVDFRDERIVRLRDAYLEPFAELAPHDRLVEDLELACRVGKIARSLIWERTVRADPDEERWRSAPFITLAAILDESYMSSR
jgi:hypothetical protein